MLDARAGRAAPDSGLGGDSSSRLKLQPNQKVGWPDKPGHEVASGALFQSWHNLQLPLLRRSSLSSDQTSEVVGQVCLNVSYSAVPKRSLLCSCTHGR